MLKNYNLFILEKFSNYSPIRNFYLKAKNAPNKFKNIDFFESYFNYLDKKIKPFLIELEQNNNKSKLEQKLEDLDLEIGRLEEKLDKIFDKYINIIFNNRFENTPKETKIIYIDSDYLYKIDYYDNYDFDYIQNNKDNFPKIKHNIVEKSDMFESKDDFDNMSQEINIPVDLTMEELLKFYEMFMFDIDTKYSNLTYIKEIQDKIKELEEEYENLDFKINLIGDIDDIENDISDYVNDFIDNISKYVDVEYNSFNDISELKEYLRNSYDNWLSDLKNENPKEYSEQMKRKARKKFNI